MIALRHFNIYNGPYHQSQRSPQKSYKHTVPQRKLQWELKDSTVVCWNLWPPKGSTRAQRQLIQEPWEITATSREVQTSQVGTVLIVPQKERGRLQGRVAKQKPLQKKHLKAFKITFSAESSRKSNFSNNAGSSISAVKQIQQFRLITIFYRAGIPTQSCTWSHCDIIIIPTVKRDIIGLAIIKR